MNEKRQPYITAGQTAIAAAARWDRRFLRLAAEVASWSKDPSTQTGAVIVDLRKLVVSLGFNGFPRGIDDDSRLHNREVKYEIILHAETNALLFAKRDLDGCTIYIYPWMPCSRCASAIIQAGIRRVVALVPDEEREARWGTNHALAQQLFQEAEVYLDLYPEEVLIP